MKIARVTAITLYEVECPHCGDPAEPDGLYGDGFTRTRLAQLTSPLVTCRTCAEQFRLPKRLPRPGTSPRGATVVGITYRNAVDHIELTQDEIWEMIDRDAHRLLKMDAETFIRRYREGTLEDSWAANDIAMLVKLGNFAEKCR